MNTDAAYSVFLVDDDRMFLASLKNSLKQEFGSLLKISQYTTGEKCIEDIYQLYPLDTPPDIVILDYYLGDDKHPETKDGIKVLKKLKTISDDTKVIMLSGQNNLQVITDSIENGAYEYITKSENSFSDTRNVLKNAIDSIHSTRENNKCLEWNFYLGVFIISMIILDVIWYCAMH